MNAVLQSLRYVIICSCKDCHQMCVIQVLVTYVCTFWFDVRDYRLFEQKRVNFRPASGCILFSPVLKISAQYTSEQGHIVKVRSSFE